MSAKRYPGVYSRDGDRTFSFRAQFSDEHGRWGVSGSGYPSRKAAYEARTLAIQEAEAQRGRVSRLSPNITVGEFLDYWLRTHAGSLRPGSVVAYGTDIRALKKLPGLAATRVRNLTEADCRRLVTPLRETGLSHTTIKSRLRLLRQALEAAVRAGLIRTNPVDGIKVSRNTERFEGTAWDAETALRFLKHRQEAGDPLFPAYRLALVTGLRRGELLGLKWSDIDLDAGVLWVRRQRISVAGTVHEGPPKTAASEAPVTLDPDTVSMLQALPRSRSGYVVPDWRTDQPWGRIQTFVEDFLKASGEAGVPRIRFHDLRHTTASLLAAAGVPLVSAQQRLRHWSPTMTARYTHVSESLSRQVADRIGAVLSQVP